MQVNGLRIMLSIFILTTYLFTIGAVDAGAVEMQGWEADGAYNKLYQSSELDRLKGVVEKIVTVTPLPEMGKGVAMIVKDGDGDKVMVHVGPEWFLGTSIGIKRGDKVKIRGAWAEVAGKDVFMAAKIKKGDFFELKVRLTKDGKPFWVMSEEEVARERAAE